MWAITWQLEEQHNDDFRYFFQTSAKDAPPALPDVLYTDAYCRILRIILFRCKINNDKKYIYPIFYDDWIIYDKS